MKLHWFSVSSSGEDCSCGIPLDSSRTPSSWSSNRSDSGVHDLNYSTRLLMANSSSTLPARHSKSLDQLGPDVLATINGGSTTSCSSSQEQRDGASPKTLPRSVSTQLLNKHNSPGSRTLTSPASAPSRNKSNQQTSSCAIVFQNQPTATTLPRAKSSQALILETDLYSQASHSTSINSLLVAMFPEIAPTSSPGSKKALNYRSATLGRKQSSSKKKENCIGTLDLAQLAANCLDSGVIEKLQETPRCHRISRQQQNLPLHNGNGLYSSTTLDRHTYDKARCIGKQQKIYTDGSR